MDKKKITEKNIKPTHIKKLSRKQKNKMNKKA